MGRTDATRVARVPQSARAQEYPSAMGTITLGGETVRLASLQSYGTPGSRVRVIAEAMLVAAFYANRSKRAVAVWNDKTYEIELEAMSPLESTPIGEAHGEGVVITVRPRGS